MVLHNAKKERALVEASRRLEHTLITRVILLISLKSPFSSNCLILSTETVAMHWNKFGVIKHLGANAGCQVSSKLRVEKKKKKKDFR